MNDAAFDTEAKEILATRIAGLQQLSYAQASALPEAVEIKLCVDGRECQLSTFTQTLRNGELLITVQIARSTLLGFVSYHVERGLIFCPDGSVREATAEQLENSGG